jgi:hypothetical protein
LERLKRLARGCPTTRSTRAIFPRLLTSPEACAADSIVH